MEERRKFVRLDTNVIVRWKRISEESSKVNETKNISAGGICLMVDENEKLNIREKLQLEIELPTKKIVYAKGEVVWIEKFELVSKEWGKTFDVGIEFIEIEEKDVEELKKFVFAILHSKDIVRKEYPEGKAGKGDVSIFLPI